MWLAKLNAAAKHFIATLLFIVVAGFLVFYLWYPGIYSRIMPATQLFVIVACVDLVLGPCMSLVIFNPKKSRKELFRDYGIIVSIQVAALAYGIFSVSLARPVYIALIGDKLQVVAASDVESNYMAASGEFSRMSWVGPKFVCLRAPAGDEEIKESIEMSANGIAQYEVPKYFKECEKSKIISAAKSMTEFKKIANGNKDNEMLEVIEKITDVDQKYVWMPIKSRFSSAIALINITTEQPEYILDKNMKLH